MFTHLFNYIYNDCKQVLNFSWMEKRSTEDNNDLGKGNRVHCINYDVCFPRVFRKKFDVMGKLISHYGKAYLTPSHRPYTRMPCACSVTQARFDISDYSHRWAHLLLMGVNKKVIGLMKDELDKRIITEFMALRPKQY